MKCMALGKPGRRCTW